MQDNENPMQFGDFIGSFVEYYAVSNSNGYKNILRIKEGFSGSKDGLGHHVMNAGNADKEGRHGEECLVT
ncbi:hypothetical protein Golob_013415 [Gossypium lobatum]|uniref:Uncharacterized protein n=1 Tax=Gossypium lobatum TaxID=34289 RepID=A0A7J8LPB2_9ROSI|nr:hypothetical protein [Gossypium lobatum]